ncbi:MAG: threonine/serine dehydratase [Acidimicrobiia bacterium]|nr:threonine/serine dehydratase [Acidimicrobiia bacterium]
MNRVTTPTREDILAAAARISGHIRRTPVLTLERGAIELPGQVILKLDLFQPTGTFKIRGAFNRLLAEKDPVRVVAASGGNFARAIAHAARHLGIAADLFVPDSSPREKIDALAAYGATVHVIPGVYHHALAASHEFEAEVGGVFAHAYDQIEVVAGAGTCGMEIALQVPEASTVLVAVGGGGLIGGISSWFRGDVKVVGVETHGTSSLSAAFAAGKPVEVEVSGIAVSSLGSNQVGEIPWEAASQWVERAVLVSDDEVRNAQHWLWETTRLIAEPGAATTVAALLSGAYRPAEGEKVVALVCGANTDPGSLGLFA